jgi:5'-3' exonuclease
LRPDQIPDLKGLEGDPGDNIPGVPKIGKKGALALIQKHANLERVIELAQSSDVDRLYANGGFTTFAETAVQHKVRVAELMGCTLAKAKLIREHAEQARASKLVGGIKQDCEMVRYDSRVDPGWLRSKLVSLGATDYLIEKLEGFANT